MHRYRERGDYSAALKLALRAFNERPNLPRYQEVGERATETGEWTTIRQDLMVTLSEGWPHLKIRVHLEEGELDDAIGEMR